MMKIQFKISNSTIAYLRLVFEKSESANAITVLKKKMRMSTYALS